MREVVVEGRWHAEKTCPVCGISYYVPMAFEREQERLGAKGGWYCPNGHKRVYRESSENILRRERDNLAQRIAEKDDEIRHQSELAAANERRVSAAKGQITKLKKRAANGVCPCCNRTFANLANHMSNKHPGFISEPDATEHVN